MLRNSKGFTLIELLVVIAIIGIMSVIALNQLSSTRTKAYDAQAKATFKNLSTAGVQYYDEYGNYNGFCSHQGNTAVPSRINQMWTSVGANCNSAGQSYRIKVLLRTANSYGASSGSDDYLCVDAAGNVKVLDSDTTTGTSC